MARPRKQIDPVKVEQMASIGCSVREIALLLDVNESTIKRRFSLPLHKGGAKLCHTVKKVLFREVNKGNTMALIFAAKCYCGLKEHADTVINVSATAVGNSIQFTEETKKQLEDFHVALQRRVYDRIRHPEKLSANGESTPALN
jgi:hypothetical protein